LVLFSIILYAFAGCAATSAVNRYRINNKNNSKTGPDTLRYSSKRLMTVTPLEELDKENDFLLEDDDEEFEGSESTGEYLNKDEVYNNLLKISGETMPVSLCSKILTEAVGLLNTPYKYGGNSENGIDCSAFTQKVFQNSIELQLPRSTREQYLIGDKISKDEELNFGDLVFFKTRKRSSPSHVGIYIGDNKFMHASRKKGVMVSSLEEKYWTPRYIGARRLNITE